MEPNVDPGDPTNIDFVFGHEGEDISDDDNPIYTLYCAETRDSSSISAQSSNKDTSPDSNSSQFEFKLGMDLVYRDGKGNNTAVFYKRASDNGLIHTMRIEDNNKLDVHDSNLQIPDQP